MRRFRFGLRCCVPLIVTLAGLASAGPSMGAITPDRDATNVASAITDPLPPGAFTGASFSVIPPIPGSTAECADTVDNDGDGFIDFTPPTGETADPGCEGSSGGASDNREEDDPLPQCANGEDDDGDGFIDFTPPTGETQDPGCSSAQDNEEIDGDPDPTAACANGEDDDGDGFFDFTPPSGETQDPGCGSASDIDEGSEGLPPGADTDPVAVADSAIGGFPTSATTFAILTSGNSGFVADPNSSGSTGQSNGDGAGTAVHGATVSDLVTLKVDILVPADRNCLRLDYRFLSEEFAEFVGSPFNDGFLAELDSSNFTVGANATNPVNAPNNFAFDAAGRLMTINSVGFSAGEALGTTYDGSSSNIRASTPITPGAHSIYLSIFDQGDSSYDSAAFIDAMRLENAAKGTCERRAVVNPTTPTTPTTQQPPKTLKDLPPPVLGKQANVEPVSGTVLVGIKGGAAAAGRGVRASQKGIKFVPLKEARQIPVGSFLDTRKGIVALQSSSGSKKKAYLGNFGSGLFQVLQSRKKSAKGLTDLVMKGGKFSSCKAKKKGKRAAAALSKKALRRLRASGKGRFRTKGRYGAATVRGTKWTVTDRCDGTLVKVTRGKVSVRDYRRKKTVLVKTGKRYLAKAPRR